MATHYSCDSLIVQIEFMTVKNEGIGKITFSHFIENLINFLEGKLGHFN